MSGAQEVAKPRVALVTGSARGLGLGVARHLDSLGYAVHVVWRSSGADQLRSLFGNRAHKADLLQAGDVTRLVDEVRSQDGRLDLLVHAVGEYISGPAAEVEHADFQRMFASNAESAYLLFQAARPLLRSSRGSAVFFGCSGLSGFRARRSTAVYAAAKSALLVLVRAWALEEAPHGVRVNMVSPGHVPHADAHADTLDDELLRQIPLGRPGQPVDIARAVAWLGSDEAGYTTGTDLLVSGGWAL